MLDISDYARARSQMVETQVERRGIRDHRLLDAMREVPREAFVDEGFEEFAYEDSPLPIGEDQTISQPYIVARMIEAAEVRPLDRVLEVGAGSGYAAAVLGHLAGKVYAVERHASLATSASASLDRLGYDNVIIRVADGTQGWQEYAPFDAIIVSAGGPDIPDALKQQLAIGGRLVIPIGSEQTSQALVKVTRTGEADFAQEDLEQVRFVPLIGEHGWQEDDREIVFEPAPWSDAELAELISQCAEPLPDFDDARFGALFDRFGDSKVVLLGESTHGTAEFYRARAAITRHLIERHGFTILAAEADWPDAAAVDHHVRYRPTTSGSEAPFQRFPTWMWRNTDVEAFIEWLRTYNSGLDAERQLGFYGLDIYNLNGSIAAVLDYLDRVDPEAARVARERYGCLTPWQKEPSAYGRAVLPRRYRECEQAVIAQCRELLAKRLDYARHDGERFFDAAQNARLIAAAEHYYRAMYYGGANTWNLRDKAMFDTLTHLIELRGPNAKAVVWAHNSHIGDARFTEMGAVRDELNIGQLCRERFGEQAALIGLGTHAGTVAAASDWGGEMEIKKVLPARSDSYERLCHDAGPPRFLLDLRRHDELRYRLLQPRLERMIGVIYRPESELASHYVDASLPQQFDAFLHFDETQAVTALGPSHMRPGAADTYPFGV
jgi:protein-L-isoaspartate(D-aspartate) O-methyltransferase